MSEREPKEETAKMPERSQAKPGAKSAAKARNRNSAIFNEPAVARRFDKRSSWDKITSNGTISAAVMVVATLLAVVVANSPIYEPVHEFLETSLSVGFGHVRLSISVEAFVNDFLMAIFFLLVGIELKYEMTVGQLRHPRQAVLPMLAAVGGVVVPALIYVVANWGGAVHGWAIPIATDIAFALGVMSLLGNRIAPETKVFFQTLAIADDILAIVVLAVFYGQSPSIAWCALSLIAILALAGLARARVYSAKPYLIVGLILWLCMYNSGIHATLAGVILAFFLPARSDIRLGSLRRWLGEQAIELEDTYDDESHVLGQHDFTASALNVERVMHHVTPPLQRVEGYFAVSVNFLILPLFAFVNAQVRLVGVDVVGVLLDPVSQGAFLGAVVGKPLGIILVTWLLVKLGFSRLPRRVSWEQVVAVGIMGGMGFTMSILIAGLAFPNPAEVVVAKCAILAGSFVAGSLGVAYVSLIAPFLRKRLRG